MQNSKLINLLKTLNKAELRKFRDFASSPYFNKNSNAVKLLKHLSLSFPEYDNKNITKENIYSEIFPGKKFNIKIIKNLMTELLRLAERFLEQSLYEKNEPERFNYLLEELLGRKQYTIFLNKYKSAEQISSDLKMDESYFYNKMNLYSLKNSFDLKTRAGLEKIPQEGKPVEYLISYFLLWYFKYSYNMINRRIGYNFDADFNFIEKVVEYVKERNFENKNIILLYYYMFMINLKWNEENYFYELKKLSDQCCDMLSRAEQFNIYTAIQTHCMRMLGAGNIKYRKFFFEAGKNMVLKDAYSGSYDDVMHPLTYKNIVKAGAHEKQFSWTLDFIERYREKLPEEFHNNIYYFSLAYCHFIKNDFQRSLKYLSIVKYENVFDKAEVNRLMMQIYYEMEWTEELLSLTDTYKHFLHNDRLIADDQKKAILNFVNFLLQIYKIKKGIHSHFTEEQLKTELSAARTYEKLWLIEKLKEINKK